MGGSSIYFGSIAVDDEGFIYVTSATSAYRNSRPDTNEPMSHRDLTALLLALILIPNV